MQSELAGRARRRLRSWHFNGVEGELLERLWEVAGMLAMLKLWTWPPLGPAGE